MVSKRHRVAAMPEKNGVPESAAHFIADYIADLGWGGFLCALGRISVLCGRWCWLGRRGAVFRSQRFAAPGFAAARPRARPSAGETLKIAVTAPASHFRSENGPKMSQKTAPAGPKVGTVFGPKVGTVFEHFLKENA